MVILNQILFLKQSNCSHKILNLHKGCELSGDLIDGNQFFLVKFLKEIELFAENHPFIQVHLVCLLGKVLKHSTGVVALLAEPLERIL